VLGSPLIHSSREPKWGPVRACSLCSFKPYLTSFEKAARSSVSISLAPSSARALIYYLKGERWQQPYIAKRRSGASLTLGWSTRRRTLSCSVTRRTLTISKFFRVHWKTRGRKESSRKPQKREVTKEKRRARTPNRQKEVSISQVRREHLFRRGPSGRGGVSGQFEGAPYSAKSLQSWAISYCILPLYPGAPKLIPFFSYFAMPLALPRFGAVENCAYQLCFSLFSVSCVSAIHIR